MRSDPRPTQSPTPLAASSASADAAVNARWAVNQAEAMLGAVVRELGRLTQSLGNAPPATHDMARLALDDAKRLAARVHALRRRVEGIDS